MLSAELWAYVIHDLIVFTPKFMELSKGKFFENERMHHAWMDI